jgi:hypothetical protein
MQTEPMITVSNLVCVTYQANSALIPYHFVGKTEAAARKQMQDWLDVKDTPDFGKHNDDEPVVKINPGKGAGLAGKVWLLHRGDQVRARVNPDEVAAYLARGYVLGGPKTKF